MTMLANTGARSRPMVRTTLVPSTKTTVKMTAWGSLKS